MSYARLGAEGGGLLQRVPLPGWKFINDMIVVLDGLGHPVVVLTGFDETPGEAVAVTRWNGTAWTAPRILDRLETSTSVGNLDAALDSRGRLHVVYDRPLVPPESYSRGFLFMVEGKFSDKCFHLLHDGRQWTGPAPTSGRGRYSVSDVTLSRGPDGEVHLAARVNPFESSSDKDYIGYQLWQDGKWGPLRRATPRDRDVAGGTMVSDAWGIQHIWRQEWSLSSRWRYGRMSRDSVAPAEFPMALWKPLIAQGPDGMLVASSGGKLTAWNGWEWSRPLSVGELHALHVSADGRVFAWRWVGREIVIREVRVRRTAIGATTRRG